MESAGRTPTALIRAGRTRAHSRTVPRHRSRRSRIQLHGGGRSRAVVCVTYRASAHPLWRARSPILSCSANRSSWSPRANPTMPTCCRRMRRCRCVRRRRSTMLAVADAPRTRTSRRHAAGHACGRRFVKSEPRPNVAADADRFAGALRSCVRDLARRTPRPSFSTGRRRIAVEAAVGTFAPERRSACGDLDLASLTKLFTGTALLVLNDRRTALGDPVVSICPGIPGPTCAEAP